MPVWVNSRSWWWTARPGLLQFMGSQRVGHGWASEQNCTEGCNIKKTKIMASGSITSWQIDGETVETVSDFYFLGSKTTADGDCSHEIKRCWLLWRKTMTNLDRILKSRDISCQFSSVQSLSRVWLFVTPWIAAGQDTLSITNSQSSLKLMCIKLVMPSSHLILFRPLLLLPPIPPRIRVFPMSQRFAWGGQSIGISALASFLPKKSQGRSPSEWTDWISLQSKESN